jgi:DNA repair protein RadC
MRLTDLAPASRPRERLAAVGAEALSAAEIVALLLGTGQGGRSALALAEALLARHATDDDPTGLRGLAAAAPGELADVPGLGPAKIGRLLAARELGRRLAERGGPAPATIGCADDAWRLLAPRLEGLDRERFVVASLTRKHAVIAVEVVAVGTLDALLVHPREVFKAAIRRSAAAVLVAHNHPSGDPTPSAEDHALTRRLLEAGEVVGVQVLDHLVIGAGRYVSLRETSDAWRARPFHA